MSTPAADEFRIASYPPAIRALLTDETEAELAAGRPRESLRGALTALDFRAAVAPHKVVDESLAAACHAGLWLAHNFLDESHEVSQQIDGPTGSFWHAIMHRREGDFGNACYWFHRVGQHPVYEPLRTAAASRAAALGGIADAAVAELASQRRWNADAFVGLVEQVVAGRAPQAEPLCRQIARREWELLFKFCYDGAVTATPGERRAAVPDA